MTAIGASERRTHAKAALRKVQAIAYGTPNAVISDPAHQALIHASLIYEIFNQASDRVVGKSRDDGGFQIEAAFQTARYVVFAAAFGNLKITRSPDAAVARVEAQHDFAQAEQVPAAVLLCLDREWHFVLCGC